MVQNISHTMPSSWDVPPQDSSNHSNSSNNISLDTQHQDELLDIARSSVEKTETEQSAEEEMDRAGAGDGRGMDGGLSDHMPCDYGGSSSETLPAGDPGHNGLRRRSHYEGQEEEPTSRGHFRRMSSRRTFFIDGQAGGRTEAAGEGYSHRADLERMVSRRTFPVQADMDGNQTQPGHQARRSSMATAARRSSVTTARSSGENQAAGAADATSLHADSMVDFFRQVNKDAYKLRRLGSDGVTSCGTVIWRGFASCLARIGLGNPSVSVQQMAFDKGDPLSYRFTTDQNQTSPTGHQRQYSGDSGLLDEEWDEDDEAIDGQTLSEQRKKVHDLGELPALDWTYVWRNLLLYFGICVALVLTTLSAELEGCIKVESLCLREWGYGVSIAIGSYFVIELLAKIIASFFKWTLLLHTNNKVWIFIKLHKQVSLLIWSVLMWVLPRSLAIICLGWILWIWFLTTEWAPPTEGIIRELMAVFVTYSAVKVVSGWAKVQMAHMYMWRPYVERAQASIWSQYVIFMMTDYAMGVQTSDTEGQALALAFTKSRKLSGHMSLYTVGKAIAFVYANALRHPLGPGRPGTDKEGIINSKTGARLFGGLLFDALMIKFNESAIASKPDSHASPANDEASAPSSGNFNYTFADFSQGSFTTRSMAKPQEAALPRPPPFKAQQPPGGTTSRPMLANVSTDFTDIGPVLGRLPSVDEGDEPTDHDRTSNSSGKSPKPLETQETRGEDVVSRDHEENRISDDVQEEKWPPSATARPPAAPARRGSNQPRHHRKQESQAVTNTGAAAAAGGEERHRRGGSTPWGRKGITLGHLRQLTKSKTLALQVLDLFEVAPEGHVSRKVFIDRMVDIFVQRKSLQLTLGDYEAILRKAGYMLNFASFVLVFFIALRIFSFDVSTFLVTWITLAVAFSFLFGSSASAFFESIIFIFVTKAYDVGDPVFFVDDTGIEDWYIVTRINLLTTVFRRWDGQATLVPNNVMATKAVRNQWRSGPLLHNTMIAVSVDTPMEKLDEVKEGIANGMRRGRHSHVYGEGGLMPDTVDYQVKQLTDGNRVAVFFLCKQRENGSNMGRRFTNASLFIKLIARECHRLGVTYTMPPQPITVNKGLVEAWRVRENFVAEAGPAK